jgi:hypothetical protein
MNREIIVTLLRKDIQELDLITESFMEMTEYPKAIILLAQRKTEDIQSYISQLAANSTELNKVMDVIEDEQVTTIEIVKNELENNIQPDIDHEVNDNLSIVESQIINDELTRNELLDSTLDIADDEDDIIDEEDEDDFDEDEIDDEVEEEDMEDELIIENEKIEQTLSEIKNEVEAEITVTPLLNSTLDEQKSTIENINSVKIDDSKIVNDDEIDAKTTEIDKSEIKITSDEPRKTVLGEKNNLITPTRNELLSKTDNSISSSLANKKITDIKQAINIGDRFRFQRELFRGNGEDMNKSINYINQLATLNEALSFLKSKYEWTEENETAEDFYQIIRRRFI